MFPKKIVFTSGDNKLIGNLFDTHVSNKQIGVLVLHGGGASSKERFLAFQEYLLASGFTSFAFDFQGVGESEGAFEEGSLIRRRADAQAAFRELQKYTKDVVVIGSSMGGHIAARLSEVENVDSLILLYPAAYAKEAEDKPLTKEFTQVLRTPNSWKNSPAFDSIKNFTGRTLIIYGEQDSIIPQEIQLTYKKVVENKGKFVKVAFGTHALLAPQTVEQKQARKQVYEEIISFLKSY